MMNTETIGSSLATVYRELVEGPSESGGYVLNARDPGLLRSLNHVDAAGASRASDRGGSIAAHVDHVRYGLSLLNRWATGEENPWASADWRTSWQKTSVSEEEWTR